MNADLTLQTALHTLSLDPASRKYMKTIWDVPKELLREWCCKVSVLVNIAWDYIDTICQICAMERIKDTKPLVRTMRELKRDYDIFRSRSIRDREHAQETRLGENFAEMFKADFSRLFFNLDTEVKKLGLTDGHRTLLIAVYQALTIIDALKIYARRVDKRLKEEHNVWTCDLCMVQTDFLKAASLVPQFAGDCLQPNLEIRKQTANILANRMEAVGIRQMV